MKVGSKILPTVKDTGLRTFGLDSVSFRSNETTSLFGTFPCDSESINSLPR